MCASVQNLITKLVWLKVKGMVEKYTPTKPIIIMTYVPQHQ